MQIKALSILSRPISALRFALAASLLAAFLLPNTAWASCSPVAPLLRGIYLYRYLPVLLIELALSLAAVSMLYFSESEHEKKLLPLWLVSLMYFTPIDAALISANNDYRLFQDIALVAVPFAVGIVCCSICGSIRNVSLIIALLAAMQASYTIYYFRLGINNFLSGSIHRAAGTFDTPLGVYTMMVVSLPVLAVQALNDKEPIFKPLFSIAAAVAFTALLITWDRGGIFSTMLAFSWIAHKLFDKKLVKVFMVGVFLSIAIFTCCYRSFGVANGRSAERSTLSRLEFWNQGLSEFKSNWLTGVGVGKVSLLVEATDSKNNKVVTRTEYEPKSVLLLWMDEFGVSGTILFCLFGVAIWDTVKCANGEFYAVLLSAAWIALISASFVDTPFGIQSHPYGTALFGCLIGCTAMLRSIRPKNESALT